MKRLLLVMVFVSLILSAALVQLPGCSGTNPGVAPSPPTEMPEFLGLKMPAFLSFPSLVSVNTDELPVSGQASAPVNKGETEDENLEMIEYGSDLAYFSSQFSALILEIFQNVNFSTCVAKIPPSYYEGASATLGIPIRIDFSSYTFVDNSGSAVSCSGNTAPVNSCESFTCDLDANICSSTDASVQSMDICFRIWVDQAMTGTYERILAGYFAEVPCEGSVCSEMGRGDGDNPGSGEYRMSVEYTADGVNITRGHIDQYGVVYDHYDADDANAKSSDIAIMVTYNDNGSLSPPQKAHVVVNQQTISDNVVKELLLTESFLTAPDDWYTYDYISRFLENGAYWRGTVVQDGVVAANNKCIEIATGIEISPADPNCTILDVTGLSIDEASTDDVAFPGDFPVEPCAANPSFSGC